ncbi:hypothetical protein [Haloechinothrix sp. LS1_15]|uniref:hypothetical protein n=1 Tax=Haloechinothrix sp. LS1_15 TaxID=2652248 RepID=UPI00294562AD|nr:hypothetical protein [Haloechinothrix sp. LS1_15]MDV6011085.1 hypothetical protein [Haloechinothrix sp. LS1_15]
MTIRLWLRPASHYTRLRLGSLGTVPGPVGELVSQDLLEGEAGTSMPDLVLVPGASLDGPDGLTEPVVDALIRCEQHTVPTVLIAGEPDDLDTPVAAVCRDVAATGTEVIDLARGSFGADRAHLLPAPARRALPGARHRHPRTHLPLLKVLARGVGLVTPRSPVASLRARLGLAGRMRSGAGRTGR